MSSLDPANPYADYDVDRLYEFLNSYVLPWDIGQTYVYSNLGGALLGHALTRRAGTDYETLLRTRIATPLNMKDTWVMLPPGAKGRLAQGHTAGLEPATNRDWRVLVGAGGLKSTTDDLLNFLGAELGYTKSPLDAALKTQLSVRRPTERPDRQVALGWHVNTSPVGDIVWHNGGTGGYRTFMGFIRETGVGIVVLSNVATASGSDDIGFHLLSGKPLNDDFPERTSIAVSPSILDRYVGLYQLGPQIFEIYRRKDRMFSRLDGQGELEIYPEASSQFFMKHMDLQMMFLTSDGSDAVSGVEMRLNGRVTGRGRRLDSVPSK